MTHYYPRRLRIGGEIHCVCSGHCRTKHLADEKAGTTSCKKSVPAFSSAKCPCSCPAVSEKKAVDLSSYAESSTLTEASPRPSYRCTPGNSDSSSRNPAPGRPPVSRTRRSASRCE